MVEFASIKVALIKVALIKVALIKFASHPQAPKNDYKCDVYFSFMVKYLLL
jgi:hypothetical protein